jgi:hypothetical protein
LKKSFTLLLLLCCALSAFAQNIDTLLYNGSIDNRINIVILGDGYLESELPNFLADAKHTLEELFKQSPFKHYKGYFNAFAIPTASVESGAALSPDQLINNYYGSTYGWAGIDRLLVPTKDDRIAEVLALNFPFYDQVLMIVNHTKYGGSGGWIATASMHDLSVEIMIHELGHSFGQLADEYWAGPQYAAEKPNMTRETSTTLVRWKNWMGDEGIDIYAYPEDNSWKHPHQFCKMKYLGYPFCAVCTEALVDRMHQLTKLVESYTPVADAIQPANHFILQLLEPVPNTLKIKWSFNEGVLPYRNAEMTLDQEELASLPDTLISEVMDTTALSRRDEVLVTRVKWVLYSDITSEIGKYYVVRPVDPPEPPITDIPREFATTASIYPNPYEHNISIDYHLKTPQQVKVRIVDFNGKVVGSEEIFQSMGNHRFEPNMRAINNGIVMLYINGKWESFKVMKKN